MLVMRVDQIPALLHEVGYYIVYIATNTKFKKDFAIITQVSQQIHKMFF